MKCELCNEKEATVHFKQVLEGSVKEIFVCESCAAGKGFNVQSPLSLANLLFGPGQPAEPRPAAADRRCRSCGLRASELRKISRLGCAECYDAFADELGGIVAGMHTGTRHAGKIPACERAVAGLAQLEATLADAVSAQKFEDAARLRDEIRAMKKTIGKAN